jgi:hypothetical protein
MSDVCIVLDGAPSALNAAMETIKNRDGARARRDARESESATRRDARDAVRERSKPGKLGVGDGLPSTHAPGVPERARGATPRAREARRATTRTLSERLVESKRFEREPR